MERFRRDIEGMRAVAVLAVVLYHADVVGGGYVGVDVFFVLSGFLITGLLWRELADTGRVSFGGFYARRARRLLPASVFVLVATVIGASVWLSPLDARAVVGDAKAAALYAVNFRFIDMRTDYLAPHAPSPLQHYWSLAVEEQFYLCWPLLMLGISRATRRRPGAVWVALATIGITSFVLSWRLTATSQPWAFFSLPARAWELIAGALIALGAARLRRLRASVAAALSWVGLAAILWSVTRYSGSTSFPGVAALLPVGGAVAVLVGGCARAPRGAGLLLEPRPMQFVGRISYAWYLWHWPVLVLAPAVVGHALSRTQNVLLTAASGVVAYATVMLVERPIRFARPLIGRPRRSLALAGALTAVALAATVLTAATLPSLRGHGTAVALEPAIHAGAGAATTVANSPTTVDPVTAALVAAHDTKAVPSNLTPSLADAAGDKAAPFTDGCYNSFTDATVHECAYAHRDAKRTVVLFGDSHAAAYFPAFELAAEQRGWRLVVLSKAVCPALDIAVYSPVLGRDFRECTQWREAAFSRIAREHPAAVVLATAHHYGPEYHFTLYGRDWVSGLDRTIRRVRAMQVPVFVLGPMPRPPGDVPSCLSAHLNDAMQCAIPVAQGIPYLGFRAESDASVRAGAQFVDVGAWFCAASLCPAIVGNLLVYRDDNHVTTTYAKWLSATISRMLDAAVRS